MSTNSLISSCKFHTSWLCDVLDSHNCFAMDSLFQNQLGRTADTFGEFQSPNCNVLTKAGTVSYPVSLLAYNVTNQFQWRDGTIWLRCLGIVRAGRKNEVKGRAGDVAQLVRAADRHAADAGSIPRCGKGFFSQSQLSVQTPLRCPYTPVQSLTLTSVSTLKILWSISKFSESWQH